ncbi:MAG: hypothetical protein OZ928_05830 [Polyangiaceae bacterium]|nr:hypothetical protein [Polyangiaceae bacterium]
MSASNTSSRGPRARATRRLLRWSLALALVLPPLAATACSSDDGGCAGVLVDGECQKRCVDSACSNGARCIADGDLNNACAAPCTSQADCALGKNCVTWGFPDGSQGQVCARLPYSAKGNSGQHVACTSKATCDTMRGFLCVGGQCELPCRSSNDCGANGVCDPSATDETGKKVGRCTADDQPRGPGQFGARCPKGDECDKDAGFACLGAGEGDVDAYCTLRDCSADSDCPADYRCALERTATPPCEASCGLAAGTGADCAAAADIGAGKKFECGPVSLLRHICEKREFCDECQTDADCTAEPDQICAKDQSGNKYCTVPCDPNTDSCPWGTAARCGLWDQERGIPTCAHRFGACHGEGKSCQPCRDDADCPGGLCIGSQFTLEKYCVDFAASCDCTGLAMQQNAICTGGGCPDTPGGLAMTCYGGPAASTSALYGKCVGANIASLLSTPQTGCWPK